MFRDDTLAADDRAFFLKVRDVVAGCGSKPTFRQVAPEAAEDARHPSDRRPGEIRRGAGQPLHAQRHRAGRRAAAPSSSKAISVPMAWSTPSHFSQDVEDYDRATEFEALGGKLIELARRLEGGGPRRHKRTEALPSAALRDYPLGSPLRPAQPHVCRAFLSSSVSSADGCTGIAVRAGSSAEIHRRDLLALVPQFFADREPRLLVGLALRGREVSRPRPAGRRCWPSGQLAVAWSDTRTGGDGRGCGARRPPRTDTRSGDALDVASLGGMRLPLPAVPSPRRGTWRCSALRDRDLARRPPLVQVSLSASRSPRSATPDGS